MKLKITNGTKSEIVECESYEEVKYDGRWKPEEEDTYFHSTTNGKIYEEIWLGTEKDIFLYSMGLVFCTEADCQAYVDYTQAVVRVNDKIDELNEGWVPDWDRKEQGKIEIFHNGNEIGTDYMYRWHSTAAINFCETKEIAQSIISSHKSDLELIFNYKKK